MHTTLKRRLIFGSAALFLLLQACTDQKDIPVEEKFVVTDSLLNKLLVDTVQDANTTAELNFSARIAANEDRQAKVFPMVGGTVRAVPVRLGDRVKAGQVLAVMGSGEMAGFDKEMISAAAELRNAERAVRQTEELYKSELSSARELEEAKNDLAIKRAEYKRASAVMKLNGGNHSGKYQLSSPISGFVIEKNVTPNMQVRPDNDMGLFAIADLSNVWAMINVYESDIARISQGDEVNLSLLSYPQRVFKGKIDKIDNLLDNDSKVVNARVSISNPDFLLKPGMMATVKVRGKADSQLPWVKSRGVIFDENKYYVLVVNQARKVRIQEIEIGRRSGDNVYISKGLNAGDRIIASKQVFLYESLKNQ
ncbi:efflux RND transporter periplasmic adaptor subunit [Desertivirga arenae]|uniref:efflux RND transporter periplasmic adaptor subunit n=1 Tax=Desertivirga arenae TaxID=2810309 RepID=UPI001A96F841|nr:efflux RND transporter periplasmic adaptor subunit [Pedobacter sp. SYSU D00823]